MTDGKVHEVSPPAEDYWTLERIALTRPKRKHGARATEHIVETNKQWTDEEIAKTIPKEKHAPSPLSVLAGTPVPKPYEYPYICVGLLLWNYEGTEPGYSGSAALVGDSTILTAAHNVWDEEGTAKNISFIPSFEKGQNARFGKFSGVKFVTPPEWVGSSAAQYEPWDYAIIQLGTNSEGKKAGTAVGRLLTLTDTAPTVGETIYDELGYEGYTDMLINDGHFLRTRTEGTGKIIIKAGTLNKGASGGPWLLRDAVGVINGVTGEGTSIEERSAYFDKALVDFVSANSV